MGFCYDNAIVCSRIKPEKFRSFVISQLLSFWVFSDENYSSLLKNWKERIKRYRKDEDLINAKEDINKIRKKRRDFKIELIKITNEYQKYVEKYETHLYILKKIPEYTIKNSKGYEIGFIDLKIEIKVITNKDTPGEYIFPCNLYFEAKTQYSTFSVLMRQLNMYKNNIRTIKSKVRNVYDTENYLFLVGPQNLKINNFEEILKDQEWQFIEIPFKIKNKKKENLQTKLF